jgi:hypothetical protein
VVSPTVEAGCEHNSDLVRPFAESTDEEGVIGGSWPPDAADGDCAHGRWPTAGAGARSGCAEHRWLGAARPARQHPPSRLLAKQQQIEQG